MKRILTLFLVLTCAWIASGGPLDSGLPVGPSSAGGGTKFPLSPPLTASPTALTLTLPMQTSTILATSPSSGALSYSSSNPQVAEVSQSGVLTCGFSTGSSLITVSQAPITGWFEPASCEVSVTASFSYYNWNLNNNCILFDGSDDMCMASATNFPYIATSPRTIMFWTKNNGNGEKCIFSYGSEFEVEFGWPNQHYIALMRGTFQYYVTATTSWRHVTVSVNEYATASVYINGVKLSEQFKITGATIGANNLWIGAASGVSYKWADKLCEFAFFNRCLSDSEISNLYGYRLTGQENGLIRLYHMDEGSGDTIHDAAGSGIDLYLKNGATWTTKL